VRLYSRPGNDLTKRFPLIAEAVARLRPSSCIIDGEAAACGTDGIACFELIRRWQTDERVFMWAFDLIELNGDDLRRDPLAVRKQTLAVVLARTGAGIRFNEHLEHEDGALVFHHACKLGLEGSSRSGRTRSIALADRRIGSRARGLLTCGDQSGRTSAPMCPQRMHTMRLPSGRIGVSSGQRSAFMLAL
jgi:hypothetical protein